MTSKKVFFVMAGVVGLMSALIITVIVAGDRLLRGQSDRLVSLKLDDQVIEAQQMALVQAKKDLDKYSGLESIARQIVPQDKDQARATREIVILAEQSGVKIANIAFPASTLGQTPTKPAEGIAPAPAPSAVTQVKPVDGIKNLFQLDITVVSDSAKPASYNQLIDFLKRLEQNRRTAQVSQISIQPDTKNRSSLGFTLTVTVYIKP